MLHNPEFDTKEVDPDLHMWMNKAVHDGRIRCFDMLEGPADGDQDLNFWEILPDKTGKKAKWNFEKEHSILHKVREIVLWGNSDNTSCHVNPLRPGR